MDGGPARRCSGSSDCRQRHRVWGLHAGQQLTSQGPPRRPAGRPHRLRSRSGPARSTRCLGFEAHRTKDRPFCRGGGVHTVTGGRPTGHGRQQSPPHPAVAGLTPQELGHQPSPGQLPGGCPRPRDPGPPWGASDVSPLPPWPPALLDRHSSACGFRWAQHLLGLPRGTLTFSIGSRQVW